jgi:hypothetical protein
MPRDTKKQAQRIIHMMFSQNIHSKMQAPVLRPWKVGSHFVSSINRHRIWAVPVDNTDAHSEHGDATLIFCVLPAENVWRIKINDRTITNNELKEEDRSVLTFWGGGF